MQVVVDTNVFVSFLTDRNLDQQERAAGLFAEAAEGKHQLLLPQVVLSEMVYVLENLYQVSTAECATLLARLLGMPGATPVHEVAWDDVLALWPKPLVSLGDALVAAACKSAGGEVLATFDANLRKQVARMGISSYW